MPKPMKFKGGILSREEKTKIEDWQVDMDVRDIAVRLNRPVKQVEKYVREYLAKAPLIVARRSEIEEFRRELTKSIFWADIKKQFTGQELVYYENAFIEYRRQYKDMTATELKQLHQLITIDIFMSRHNTERKYVQDEIDRIERILKKEHEKDPTALTDAERQFIQHNEVQLQAYKAATTQKTREFKDLLDKHEDLLKSLKSTRDQRIKTLEDRGKFISILKELEVSSRRQSVSEAIGLVDLAIDKEKNRLSQPYQYKDNMIDLPLLNSETVGNLDGK